MKSILIIGLGWLGKQLAESLIAEGYIVDGTNTKKRNFRALRNHFVYSLGDELEAIKQMNYDVVIVTLPPSSNKDFSQNSIRLINQTLQKQSSKTKVLFCSSTSIYGDVTGEVDETTAPKPNTSNGKQLLFIEQQFQDSKNFVSMRFGGLVGKGRHPVSHLSAKKSIKGKKLPINLIHAEDIIAFVKLYMTSNYEIKIVNLVAPLHPLKGDYYKKIAQDLHLKLPEFDEDKRRKGKIVNSLMVDKMNFKFNFPNPYQFKF